MPNWTENEFVEQAKDLARRHVATNKTINDLAEKVAKDQSLSPDEIRTLVRMTNVQVFQEKFASMSGEHKMVEFETGDPEAVIQRIHQDAGPVQSANIHNDKLASEIPDFMYETRTGVSRIVDTEKIASKEDEDPVPLPRKDKLIMATEKLAHEMDIERLAAGHRWEEKLGQLVQYFKGIHRDHQFTDLYKSAFATYGGDALPEMKVLRDELQLKLALFDEAHYESFKTHQIATDSPQLDLFKEAVEARHNYVKLQKAVDWLNKNKPRL